MIKCVIFDLDGTLLNTFDDLADAVNNSLTMNGLKAYTTKEIKGFVGNGIKVLIEKALAPQFALDSFNKVFNDFQISYKSNFKNKTNPYKNIPDVLQELKKFGIKLAVLTNKHQSAAEEMIEYYFPNTFEIVIGQDKMPLKPHPTAVIHIANNLNIPLTDILMIGDTTVDIQTAKNAKVKSVGVFWGYEDINLIYAADFIAKKPKDIIDFIVSINKV